jgi:hypothetical protein
MQPNTNDSSEPQTVTASEGIETNTSHEYSLSPIISDASTEKVGASEVPTINKVWTRNVKTVNIVCLILALLCLVFIDIPIVISTPGLAPFLIPMLIAFVVLAVCALHEWFVANDLRNTEETNHDGTMLGLIYLRNIIVILNVIPLIQLFGILTSLLLVFTFPVYYFILAKRLGSVRAQKYGQ